MRALMFNASLNPAHIHRESSVKSMVKPEATLLNRVSPTCYAGFSTVIARGEIAMNSSTESDYLQSSSEHDTNLPKTKRQKTEHSNISNPERAGAFTTEKGGVLHFDSSRLTEVTRSEWLESSEYVWPYGEPEFCSRFTTTEFASDFNSIKSMFEKMGETKSLEVGQYISEMDSPSELGFTKIPTPDFLTRSMYGDVYVREDRIVFISMTEDQLEFSPEALQWVLFSLDTNRRNPKNDLSGIVHKYDFPTAANIRGEYIETDFGDVSTGPKDVTWERRFCVQNLSQREYYKDGLYDYKGYMAIEKPGHFVERFMKYANAALDFHREQYGWPRNTHISNNSSNS